MSGSFGWQFFWSSVIFIVAFLLLCGIFYCLVDGWTLTHAFIQLSNPSPIEEIKEISTKEQFGIVLTNLLGLFVLNGLLLTLLVNWVSNRKERHERGEARYGHIFAKRFVAIIGGHKIVGGLVRDLASKNDIDYILIQTERDAIEVRREIEAAVKNGKALEHVIIYSGDRTSWHELEDLHLGKAHEIYIIGESFAIDKTSHDSISMETWRLMNEHIKGNSEKKIRCHIMFEYQSTFNAFQFTDLKLTESTAFRFIPFSIYENWAQQVLICPKNNGEDYYMPLDGEEGISYTSDKRVHLVVVGMSKMGIALALEAAHLAHYPNFNNPAVGRPRTLITFVDRNARREMLYFMGRFRDLFQLARWRYVEAPKDVIRPTDGSWDIYDTSAAISQRSNSLYTWHDPLNDADFRSPYYGGYLGDDLIDMDFEFIEGDVALPSIQKYMADACADKLSKTTIAVCIPIAVEALSSALYFEPPVYRDVQQIWVQQPESGALADAIRFGLTGQDSAKYRAIRPFGMIEQCDYSSRIHSLSPKLINYAYDLLYSNDSLGDKYKQYRGDVSKLILEAESSWLNLSQSGGKSAIAKRWSNVYAANSFDTKVRSSNIDLSGADILDDEAIVDIIAKTEHNRWVVEQLLMGFRPLDRSYSDRISKIDRSEKNELKSQNIHPDLISNEKLNDDSSQKDKEIARIIPLIYHIIANSPKND